MWFTHAMSNNGLGNTHHLNTSLAGRVVPTVIFEMTIQKHTAHQKLDDTRLARPSWTLSMRIEHDVPKQCGHGCGGPGTQAKCVSSGEKARAARPDLGRKVVGMDRRSYYVKNNEGELIRYDTQIVCGLLMEINYSGALLNNYDQRVKQRKYCLS